MKVNQGMKSLLLAILAISFAAAMPAQGKGLDELAQENPESAPTAGAANSSAGATTNATQTTVPREVKGNLYLGTSFGWVSGSRAEGNWRTSGMTDVTIGYLLPTKIMNNLDLFGTYRYAPIAVAGDIDGNSYRGVWDIHYFGAMGQLTTTMGFSAVVSAEIGYGLVFLDSTDGIELEEKHEENGVSVTLGGGADWQVLKEKGFHVGPRIYLGFGGFTTFQFSANATYMF